MNRNARKTRVIAAQEQRVSRTLFHAFWILLALIILAWPGAARACEFFVPDEAGNAIRGPSFDRIDNGFTHGLLRCGGETHGLMIMTLAIDINEPHIGVRDDPLFKLEVLGPLERVDDIQVSGTSSVYVLGRANASPRVGNRRGFVRFATLCDEHFNGKPLNCSWGSARIKFRATTVDTNADEKFDRTYHELSIYRGEGKLHMVTFWTPHRRHIKATTADWITALHAFGFDVAKKGPQTIDANRG
ncbi:MAG: hypothetical protein AAGE89_12725 [Pseudomonadota bacterium]